MKAAEFLKELLGEGIRLRLEGDRLISEAPPGVLTPGRMAEIRMRKEEVIAFLVRGGLGGVPSPPPIRRLSQAEPAPLSFAQQRLWFLDRIEQRSDLYNLPLTIKLAGRLDREVLRRSIEAIVARHEVLRTTFPDVDGIPYQSVSPDSASACWEWRETDVGAQVSEEGLAELLRVEAGRPFDLASGPLLRVGLFRRGEEDHVLQVVMHHTVSDAWSMGVFWSELGALYEAFLAGEPSPLPELPIQCADFAVWQREWLKGEVLEEQLSYWRERLADLAPLELPTDRPRPAVQSFRGGTQPLRLGPELVRTLRALGLREGATLFMTMTAAFQTLLHRYSGQTDIAVGTPFSGRNRSEIEGLVGMFVNTLVIRSDLTGDPSFRELLGRVRDASLEAHAHQDLPFEKLVEELQPQRELSRNPLFQVMLALQNAPEVDLALPGLEVGRFGLKQDTSKFDLTLFLWEATDADGGEVIEGAWEYATDLFDEATIERMQRHFETLIEAIVRDPSRRISELELLTDTERHQLLVEWNDTAAPHPNEQCLHQLIEVQVDRTPEAVALVYEGQSLTYGELNARANKLAHHLRNLGVGPEVLVGICAERSLEMVVGLLGILKAGGAYVPLDPSDPQERLVYMLGDAGAKLLLTQQHLLARLPDQQTGLICLDRDWSLIEGESGENPNVKMGSDALAYMIYTSGSTGKPKGALNTHEGICNRLLWMQEEYQITPDDSILQKTPFSFDVSVWELFWPLMTGACLVMAIPGGHQDPSYLIRTVKDQSITVMHFVPSMLQAFLEAPNVRECASLRHVICSGEALSYDLQERFFSRMRAELHNLYGPTEAAVDVTYWACRRENDRRYVPIGRPVANTQIYVLDGNLQPAPIGVPGELHIGGRQVGRGYHNRPELTAERFIPDPFIPNPNSRLYKTGDLCRWLPDGSVEYLGRNDFQVKIRGFRIELGEIEARLAACPGVREAAVIAREDHPGDQRLVAYVVVQDQSELPVADLREQLGTVLPEYMVPAAFVGLPALPLTPSGKLDRKALPAPDPEAFSTQAYELPKGPIEEALAETWSDVLGVARVGRHDDFFALGGHSLLATQVMSRMVRDMGVELPLRSLFESPTVAELAERIGAVVPGALVGSPPIERLIRAERAPLSFAQQRLWFLDRIEQRSDLYNMPLALELTGRLDRKVLRRSIEAIVARHEVLRTAFPDVDGVPYQAVYSDSESACWEWKETDVGAQGSEVELAELLRVEAGRPFDLASGPLLRVGLFCRGEEDHVLQVTMHHTVSDGWSVGVFRRELSTLYTAFLAGDPSPLTPLLIQYADYSAWQQEWLQGEVLEKQLGYWREQLAALTPLDLPTDRPRPGVQSFRGGSHRLRLSQALAAGLRALSREEGSTLFMTVMAAFHVLLHRYSDQTDIAVGTPIAGRNRSELEGLMGMFVNTLVVRSDLTGDPSFRELLKKVRDTSLAAHAYQDLPFERLVEELQPQRDLSRNPLFQVMFALQNAPDVELTLPGLEARSLAVGGEVSIFDLSLSLWGTAEAGEEGAIEEAIEGSWTYATDLFDAATIERMQGHFELLLEGIVADPDAPVGRLALMGKEERRQLVEECNATELKVPQGVCVHHLFEARVGEDPDRVALVAQDGSLTYGELESKANQLARHLVVMGVTGETLVGVSLPRTTDMVVAVLGILKAGGAYLPLDPDLPPERLGYMLEDGGATVLVTSSEVLESFPPFTGGVVCLDRDSGELEALSDTRPEVAVDPDQLAYVIYTSGSTGRPKGVEVCHRNVISYLLSLIERPGQSVDDIQLAVATLSFDTSVQEIFGPLSVGARVVLASQDLVGDGDRLRALVEESGINLIDCTPATWRMLFNAGWQGDKGLRAWTGSEALPPDLARELVTRCGEVWNLYGPTETTVTACGWRVPTDADQIRIGFPLNNARLYALDSRMQPVPVGVPGELHIGGGGVTRGYRNRPELTAERFVPDQFSEEPGARLYRTGDRVRFRDDGTLEYMGRLDNQVKIRGFRIELGEIEARLGEHEAVGQVAVMVHGEDVDARLVAYVVFGEGSRFDLREMRRFLRRSLPDYMVPSLLIELDELPLTPSGKLDRKALPDPKTALPSEEEVNVAPRTPTEEVLAGIWAEVLGRERVGVDDDFFALGGHSLLATQVMSRMVRDMGVELPLRSLFESPTVAELAERIAAIAAEAAPATQPIERTSRDEPLPLSFAQERLWILDRIEGESSLYNIPVTFELLGHLDAEVLRQSLDALVERHEVLRTSFPSVGGSPYQAILRGPSAAWEWGEEELSGFDNADAVHERIEAEAKRPFHLETGPLLRARLFRRGEENHVLQVVMHHSVSDAWSMGVFWGELSSLYGAFLAGEPSPLPELPIQYADFAVWQREWLKGEVLEEQLSYWRERLADLAPLEFPTDRPRPAIQSFRGATQPLRLRPELARAIRALGRREGAPLFMTLMAAFQTLLHRYSGQMDIAVGTPLSGRNRSEIEGMMGLFINTLVIRSNLTGDPSFRELLRQVRDASLEAHAHQDLPFERLVEELQPGRDLSRNPLFQVMLTLQNAPEDDLALPGLEVSPFIVEQDTSKFDLTLFLWETTDADEGAVIEGAWEYATDLFDEATIERMQRHFETLLEAIVRDPSCPVSELELLSKGERRALLEECNQTTLELPAGMCVHQLFEGQVAGAAKRVAVVDGDGSLTYGELESRSNQLARHLVGLGVEPETLVGVNLSRTTDLLVTVLAILKAGGAYLPLDAAFPAERLAYMLEDAGAPIVVTTTELLASLPSYGGHVLCLDRDGAETGALSDRRPGVVVDPGQPAYAIYTSGSTGRPKGVEVTHGNVVNFLLSMAERPGLSADDVLLAVTTLSFDISVLELLGPLSVGGRVVVADGEETASGERLRERLAECGATVIQATPATWRMLFEADWQGDGALRVLVGGEALPLDLAQELATRCGEVWNMYGPTETTVWSSCWRLPEEVGQIRIGTPIGNTQLYVLDARMRPTPLGIPGELYIGGLGVTRGYRDRPELTAERFVTDPFSSTEGARLYRTGDLARWIPDGTVEFLGRLDNQVKIRGFRIELGEIEAVLAENEAVRQAVVNVAAAGTADARLVAYVVLERGESLTVSEIRRFLRNRVPDYMVPGLVVELDDFPLTANGKIDRKALPDPLASSTRPESKFSPPSTHSEILIAEVWAELLTLDQVSRHDNFFELGGHSLLSLRAVAAVAERNGGRMDPRWMFFQTLEQLATQLDLVLERDP